MLQIVKRNGQVTIPKLIRDKIGLKDGDFVSVELKEGASQIVIKVHDVEISQREF